MGICGIAGLPSTCSFVAGASTLARAFLRGCFTSSYPNSFSNVFVGLVALRIRSTAAGGSLTCASFSSALKNASVNPVNKGVFLLTLLERLLVTWLLVRFWRRRRADFLGFKLLVSDTNELRRRWPQRPPSALPTRISHG